MPCALCLALPAPVHAYEYNRHGAGLRLSGEGMAGGALPETFIYDWRVRGQANYAVHAGWTAGAVYSIDQLAIDDDKFARDAFLFGEGPFGRVEVGVTNSIAAKLGLGLPDVGSLRVNEYSIAYKIIDPHGSVITSPVVDGTRYALRANIATVPTNPFQFGASFAPWDPHFNTATDIGMKYRQPYGKTKLAVSAGASHIDAPRDLSADIYAPRVTADSRTQVTTGLNIQYNSWNLGLTARGIYDVKPVGALSDGVQTGTGLSYDFLEFSASASYMLSLIGIWHTESTEHTAHTGILSLRYKINKYLNVWTSGGAVYLDKPQPFIAAGLSGKF